MAGYEPLSIDLRLLESFVILAEELHFTRAAERLHIAVGEGSIAIRFANEHLSHRGGSAAR